MAKITIKSQKDNNYIKRTSSPIIQEKVVYIEKPIEIIKEKHIFVDKPVEKVVEIIKEKPIEVIKEVEKLIKEIVEIEKPIEIIKEKEVIVEKIIKVPYYSQGLIALCIIEFIVCMFLLMK